jgi:hypothetical protein
MTTTRLINTHDQLIAAVEGGTIEEAKAVAVSYHAKPAGRLGWGDASGALAWSPFMVLSESVWRHGGAKHFPAGRNWREAVEQAKAWASEKFGITDWARNRVGDFVPAEVNAKHPIPSATEPPRGGR